MTDCVVYEQKTQKSLCLYKYVYIYISYYIILYIFKSIFIYSTCFMAVVISVICKQLIANSKLFVCWMCVCVCSIQSSATHVRTVHTHENKDKLVLMYTCFLPMFVNFSGTCFLHSNCVFISFAEHMPLSVWRLLVTWDLHRNVFCRPLASCLSCTIFLVDLVRINASPFSAGHSMPKARPIASSRLSLP